MGWSTMLSEGEDVMTPHGKGRVRRVSAKGNVQVDVGGQLFDVPENEVSVPKEGADFESGDNIKEDGKEMFTKGDRVKGVDVMEGIVEKVTQRSVYVGWDNGKVERMDKPDAETDLTNITSPQPNKLKIGDRVRATEDFEGASTKGVEGTIRNKNETMFGVEFDEQVGGHDLEGDVKDGHGWYVEPSKLEKIEDKKEEKKEPTKKETDGKSEEVADSMYGLLQLQKHMEEKVDEGVEKQFKELKDIATSNQKLEVKVGDKTNELKGLKHFQLEQLIQYSALRLSPLLVGMAGTGKTHAAEQVSEALGLPFYSMSVGAQTSKSDIIGYMNASGTYVRTHFRDAYENGGIFLMDEIDAGNANVLIQVNAALSNGVCAFPDAMIKKHEDFVFIASANTYGNGANRQYVGRNQLDAATLDRFSIVDWKIDNKLEKKLSFGVYAEAWYKAVRAARDYVADKKIRALISPRATQKGCALLDTGQQIDEVITATITASVPDDKKKDVEQVVKKVFESKVGDVPGIKDEIAIGEIVKG